MFPWTMFCLILGPGLLFTCYCIYYIMRLAHDEMNEE